MRKLVTILVLAIALQAGATRRFLGNEGWGGASYTMNVNFVCNPGDTLLINDASGSGSYSFTKFIGTLANPIVIINYDSPHSFLPALAFHECKYIKVTGSGGSDWYGLVRDGGTVAVTVDANTKFFESERLLIMNSTYAAWIKMEASCYDSLNYPNRLDNISWHDTYAWKITQDAYYFGSTGPNGGRPNGCGQSPVPMRLSNISFYNNIIDSCGRTGAQFSGVDSGLNYVRHNTIRNTGYEYNQTQGGGIIIGQSSKNFDVSYNYVAATYQLGIKSLGYANIDIHDNIIDSSAIIPIKDGGDSSKNSTPLVKELSAGGNINDIYIKITGTKVSGTPAGIAYVVAAADGSTTYTAVSDTFTITNVSSQSKTWHINAYSKRYWRVRIEGTGTQVSTWKEAVLNPGYDFSIGADAAVMYPSGDSSQVTIRNNVCDNSDAYNITIGTPADLWKRSGNYICNNTTQSGGAVTLSIGANFNYSTDCSGLGGAISGAKYNYLRLKRGVKVKIR